MPKPRIKDLVPTDDMPMAAQVQRFITHYVNCRDLKEAACKVSLMPEMGEKLFKQPKVRTAIQKRINLVETEIAKQTAKAQLLTVPLLDASLVEEVKSRKNGHIRIRAIELGYKRTGLIRDGEFYVAPDPNANKNAPSIYQSKQITMRRTVTEEVTQTMPTVAAEPAFKVLEY